MAVWVYIYLYNYIHIIHIYIYIEDSERVSERELMLAKRLCLYTRVMIPRRANYTAAASAAVSRRAYKRN